MYFAAMVFPRGKRVKLELTGKRPTKRRARGETRAGAQTREYFMKRTALVALGALALACSTPASAQERTVKITGFGAKSGVVRIFGVNSEAALRRPPR